MKRLLLVSTLLAATVQAEPLNYNVISLDAEARREVANDLMRANLFAEFNDADPARLESGFTCELPGRLPPFSLGVLLAP